MPDGRAGHHDLEDGHPAHPLLGRKQTLGDHGQKRRRQLGANLALLVGGEDVNHPIDGLDCIVGVQSGQNQMPGLRRGDGR